MIISLAASAKRLHDSGKSGWWLLLFYLVQMAIAWGIEANEGEATATGLSLISFAVVAWMFVELACLRGTVGPNKYGPDPLATDETLPAATA